MMYSLFFAHGTKLRIRLSVQYLIVLCWPARVFGHSMLLIHYYAGRVRQSVFSVFFLTSVGRTAHTQSNSPGAARNTSSVHFRVNIRSTVILIIVVVVVVNFWWLANFVVHFSLSTTCCWMQIKWSTKAKGESERVVWPCTSMMFVNQINITICHWRFLSSNTIYI